MVPIGQPQDLRSPSVALSEWSPRHGDTMVVFVELLHADPAPHTALRVEILGRDSGDMAEDGRPIRDELRLTLAIPQASLTVSGISAWTRLRFSVVGGAWVHFQVDGITWFDAEDPADEASTPADR